MSYKCVLIAILELIILNKIAVELSHGKSAALQQESRSSAHCHCDSDILLRASALHLATEHWRQRGGGLSASQSFLSFCPPFGQKDKAESLQALKSGRKTSADTRRINYRVLN